MTYNPKTSKAERRYIRKLVKTQIESLDSISKNNMPFVDLDLYAIGEELDKEELIKSAQETKEYFMRIYRYPKEVYNVVDPDYWAILLHISYRMKTSNRAGEIKFRRRAMTIDKYPLNLN